MVPAALLACSQLAVPAAVMQHVAMVESSGHPYAIGVVGGRLLRQPASLDEAIATAESLEAQGYNFSVGVAQVNRGNFAKYGLDSYAKAFSLCDNLVAGSRILADCYARHHGAWGKAFSCYYSGDPETGFREGYVQKVFAAMAVSRTRADGGRAIDPIPVVRHASAALRPVPGGVQTAPAGSPAYRALLRSLPVVPTTEVEARSGAVAGQTGAQHVPRAGTATGGGDGATAGIDSAAAPAQGPEDRNALTADAPSPTTRHVASAVLATGRPEAPEVSAAGAVFQPRVSALAAGARDGAAGDAGPDGAATTRPRPEVDAAFVF